MNVLYVDDDEMIREVAEMSLALDPQMAVRVAPDGPSALAVLAARDWRADVLLIDVMMPSMDGPQLLQAIRGLEGYAATPAIFFTARAMPEEKQQFIAAGAVGVLTKPFDPMQLAAEIRSLLPSA